MRFNERVYELCSRIPSGRISTYKLIAEKMNSKAYRAVGQALKHNPNPPTIPCHRVVASSGNLGGFSGKLMSKKKIRLLKEENITIKNNKIVDFEKKLYKF